jgi:uncharacterized membrane protein YheB (UPF0754 family)
MDKGTASNVASACCLGISLTASGLPPVFFTASMFAFSGGITNWLAVKMLFDRVPGLIGSGVIPARFKEIRSKVKDLIMEHFFDEEHLRDFLGEHTGSMDWGRYLKTQEGSDGPMEAVIRKQWDRLTAPEVVQPIVDRQIEKLMQSPIGGMLLMVGVDKIRPTINQFVSAFIESMQGKLFELASQVGSDDLQLELDEEALLHDVRGKVDQLLERKLEQLHSDDVKRMMEDVIRQHLGWLVVWGNVFGGILGVIAFYLNPSS